MHDVVAILHLSYVLTAFEFIQISKTIFDNSKLKFHGHYSYFRKDFQMLITLKEGHT